MFGVVSPQSTTKVRERGEKLARPRPWPVSLIFPPPPRRQRSSADLARMIESEIIPRLMLTHGAAAPEPASPDPAAVDAFVRLTLAQEAPAIAAHVRTLVQDGLPLESAYVELLAPAARRLGDDWVEDRVSFTEVTIGLSRLQQAVRSLAVSFPPRDTEPNARAACFVTAPGEQHAFGLCLVEDRFRRGGWRTHLDTAATREDAAEAVAQDWFDVFGVSATSDTPWETVASVVALVRRRSRNPRLFVLAGGGLFAADPALAERAGADAYAESAAVALSLADKAVQRPALA